MTSSMAVRIRREKSESNAGRDVEF
jgi:hypothetical protein